MARFIVDVANLPQDKIKFISETICNAVNDVFEKGAVVTVTPTILDNTNQFMEDTFFPNETQVEEVDDSLFSDICNLEIFRDSKQYFYAVIGLTHDSITLRNIVNMEDEYYLDIIKYDAEKYYLNLDEIGYATNLEDFYSDLTTAFLNQNVSNEKTLKRCQG